MRERDKIVCFGMGEPRSRWKPFVGLVVIAPVKITKDGLEYVSDSCV